MNILCDLQNWGFNTEAADGSDLLGHGAVSLTEWVLTILRNMVYISSRDKELRSKFWTAWPLKMKAKWSSEISGTTHPMTQWHIPEYLNPLCNTLLGKCFRYTLLLLFLHTCTCAACYEQYKRTFFLRFFKNIFVLPVSILNAFCGPISGSECILFHIAVLGYYVVLICN